MPKLFRFLESLGRSSREKWSQIRKLFLSMGVKLLYKKKMFFFFGKFCLTSRIFWYYCYFPHRSRDALSAISGILKILLGILSYLGLFTHGKDQTKCFSFKIQFVVLKHLPQENCLKSFYIFFVFRTQIHLSPNILPMGMFVLGIYQKKTK